MTSRQTWILGVVAAAALIAGLLWFKNDRTDAPASDEIVAVPNSEYSGAPDGASSAVESPRQRSRSGKEEKGYEVSMGDPFLEPRSEAEVEWLRRNRYPSAAARSDAAQFMASELDFDHRDGIEAIEIVAAEQYARQHPDNRERAVEFLNEAAISGSTYALETLGRLHGSADPVTSEAYFRAAAHRGDWNAHLRVKPPLTSEQEMLASLLAHQVIENLELQRRRRGLPALGNDQRPGLDQFLRQIKEAERAAAASRS
ncbi:hypothetical protein QFW80_16815 [Luteimonas sp. M1R5S18]|uniref:Sel1 repeat-containing protein n=1 Tax=Luteimonas rhizosphaericola TaxID=3042024 RepID=A0ABT6JNT7_9GAMM|nr:hypothetical protein [Luteimonas rhizosphaericola]MDH5832182.1 hypothetical protein [Luteimonas rhizosphaericola]